MKKISAHKSGHNLSDDDNHEIFEQLTVIIANVDFLFHKEFDIQKEENLLRSINFAVDNVLDILIKSKQG